MKKVLLFFIPFILTALIIFLPDVYFKQSDKLNEGAVGEEDIYVQVEGDISVDKMIEIAQSDDSRYVELAELENTGYIEEPDSTMQKEMSEVIGQLETILEIKITDKDAVIKNSIYKKCNVIGNSGLNSYSFSLSGMFLYGEEYQFFVVYIPDKKEILSADIFKLGGAEVLFDTVKYEIEERIAKYYGHDNFRCSFYQYEMNFRQGVKTFDVTRIFDRMEMVSEVEEISYN